MARSSLVITIASIAAVSASYEWAGSFLTPDTTYTWIAQKVGGDYADPAMKLVLVSVADASAATLTATLSTGDTAIDGTCPDTPNGATLTPSATGNCYNLVFEANQFESLFTVSPSSAAAIAFFGQHVPTEFEESAHYLKATDGTDVEPGAENTPAAAPAPAKKKPWGEAIGAAILVNIITFSGIVFLSPGLNAIVKANEALWLAAMSSFAAGALIACALFLLLFEAVHLVGTVKGVPESWHTFRWGVMVLVGFITSFVLDTFSQTMVGSAVAPEPGSATTDTEKGVDDSAVGLPMTKKLRVLGGVLIGDFMHNFCDGIFMGTAFHHCSGKAWGITTATILHEIPQELADYLVLTNPGQGGLKPLIALVLNFVSGTSVILGVLVVLSTEPGDYATGMLLAYGGGVYLQIGAAECMPRVFEACHSLKDRVICLFMFTLGCILLGLILLDHEHCSAGGGGHGHGA